ncbi:MAG: glycine--tRNA ligase subunit beta, partial [Gammaproteobacteria bacterium]|nr:glycine--tRNA ligase subunit beta [Gammaproteobacteria bacterium]
MPARSDFLLEIGVEELPPKALRGLDRALRSEFRQGLEEAGLEFDEVDSFATPRRLAVVVRELATRQPPRVVEKRGPPLAAARGSGGDWSRAAEGFAESCGCRPEDLEILRTEKGEWLMYRGRRAGKPAASLLPEIAARALTRLPVGRAMRWGSGDEEFIRPVHWVVMLHGKRVVPGRLLGRRSGRRSSGHR